MTTVKVYQDPDKRSETMLHDLSDDTWWNCSQHPLFSRAALLSSVAQVAARADRPCGCVKRTRPTLDKPLGLPEYDLILTVEVKDG